MQLYIEHRIMVHRWHAINMKVPAIISAPNPENNA